MNPNRMLEFASTGQSASLHDDTVLSYDSGEAFWMKHVPTIKERDRALITDVVRRFGPLSRVKLHELTHFRPATIGAVVRELLDEGVLAEGGLSNNPTGRKQILLELNEKLGYVVTLDFDAETVSAGMMDVRAKLRNSVIRESTDLANGREGLLRQLLSCVERTIQQAGPESGRPLGIGIGDPGLVNSQEGISVFLPLSISGTASSCGSCLTRRLEFPSWFPTTREPRPLPNEPWVLERAPPTLSISNTAQASGRAFSPEVICCRGIAGPRGNLVTLLPRKAVHRVDAAVSDALKPSLALPLSRLASDPLCVMVVSADVWNLRAVTSTESPAGTSSRRLL